MTIKITTQMLDAFGPSGHGVPGCNKVREVLRLGGVTEEVELHAYEYTEVKSLRDQAAKLTARADQIEARGPWPDGVERSP